ncbi:ribonuclease HI [Trypanosoma cruzi]|nr:ribonuclease HI [Trypanosoma cruzi]
MSSISVLFPRLRLARHRGNNLLLGNCGGVLLPGDEVAPSRGAGALPEYKNIAAGGRCERDGDHDDVIVCRQSPHFQNDFVMVYCVKGMGVVHKDSQRAVLWSVAVHGSPEVQQLVEGGIVGPKARWLWRQLGLDDVSAARGTNTLHERSEATAQRDRSV